MDDAQIKEMVRARYGGIAAHLARLHGSDYLRVAAAKPKIGALRNRRELRLGIAHPPRLVVLRRCWAAAGRRRRGATGRLACLLFNS